MTRAALDLPALARRAKQPDWIQPMLATLTAERDLDESWVYETKFDGIRALAFKDGDRVRLLSRNKLDLTGDYPDVVEAIGAQPIRRAVLDGEVVAFAGDRSTFEILQQRRTLGKRARIVFEAFDILHLEGHDLTRVPLEARKEVLHDVLERGPHLDPTSFERGDAASLLERACAAGTEGLIAKRIDAPYRGGRSRDWLKLKCSLAQEFVVGGFSDPKGSREGLGALLLGTYDGDDLRYAGEVGTGFSHELLRTLRARLDKLERDRSPFADLSKARPGVHWVQPKLVAQVAFTEWTRDGKLRHPRFQGLRADKSPKEVVRERPS